MLQIFSFQVAQKLTLKTNRLLTELVQRYTEPVHSQMLVLVVGGRLTA